MSGLTCLERIDDMFPDMFRRLMRPLPAAYEALAEIRVDVSENDKAYEVCAEVPGAKKGDSHCGIADALSRVNGMNALGPARSRTCASFTS